MDTKQILAAVKAEVTRLNKVIALLETDTPNSSTPAATNGRKPKTHKWTAAERKAMSLKQKARWAKIKAAKKR
jgi:hypothetical protein